MNTTIELLNEAIRKTEMSARALSMKLGHSPWTINRARERGTLSPVLAGQLAELLELDIGRWMALAAIESEPRSRVTDHLRRAIAQLTI